MKKILTIIFCLAIVLNLTACMAEDMTKGKTPEQIIKEAIKKTAEWENYEMEITSDMTMNVPPQGEIEMQMKGKGVAFTKPFKMYMAMDIEVSQLPEPQSIEQYIVQEEDAFIIYQNFDGQWYKQKIEAEGINELMSIDPMESIQLFTKYIKSAEIVEETMMNDRDVAKIDVTVSFDMYKELMEKNESFDMGNIFGMNIFESLGNVGDLTYSIWVEKATLNIVQYDMDLSEAMNKMADAIKDAEGIPQEIIDAYKSSEMQISVKMYNQNKAKDFEIPEEALNAKELSSLGQ